ncbi:MAG: molybdopterin-guanine dinucleotide biosynthesis protein B [Planctomycetota bacterium]|jgi:molybdopterin-guanine dinucleotide biosynthesis protein B
MRVVCFVGWSGSGKTTLVERLLPRLAHGGRKVAYLKTDAHGFTMDKKGKDTARLYDTGADRVAIIGPDELAIRVRRPAELGLQEVLDFAFDGCDLVLIEGGKNCTLPMIEMVHGDRPAVPGTPPHLLALVGEETDGRDLPFFDRDDVDAIAAFVEERILT